MSQLRLHIRDYYDRQHREHLNCLFFRDPQRRVIEVDNPREADFVVVDSREIAYGCNQDIPVCEDHKRYIVTCFGDLYQAMGGLRFAQGDQRFQLHMRQMGKKLIYLMCEIRPTDLKRETPIPLFYDNKHVILLTLPLGYLDGPMINIYYTGNDSSAFFIKNLSKNNKNYEYDWSFIGCESSRDRTEVIQKLRGLNGLGSRGMLNVHQPLKEADRSKRQVLLHASKKQVPHDKYIDICQKSKVCLSLNGVGMWSPRDGEFLSRNCFCLRQYHENLNVNILTPKDGHEWVVFKNDELEEKLQYYIENNDERERINDAGHEFFKKGITGGWAKYYVDSFLQYLGTEDADNAFRHIMVKP